MFKTIKETIKETAYSAVMMAENELSSAAGKEKKAKAIEFVVSKISVAQPFKSIIVILLSKFIDKAVEQAVTYMKSVQYEQER
ncbi:hypothetical protein IJ818_06005 [bacterium]|nr:hypothetical protein [bacterium]